MSKSPKQHSQAPAERRSEGTTVRDLWRRLGNTRIREFHPPQPEATPILLGFASLISAESLNGTLSLPAASALALIALPLSLLMGAGARRMRFRLLPGGASLAAAAINYIAHHQYASAVSIVLLLLWLTTSHVAWRISPAPAKETI